ncbi:hypothetical protein FLAG1_09726 [Fusarium langsethiae]|uniref:Apple domain-containing protein n=1 Tax=Fusarium langsethiae TaxID=179993 RepID=A0A0M9EPV2_FUSLA|nr:hypothetical protein FLAG1_09726 [Fusarium langsethiae]GKU06855.1 unnamed protein product [Fusarium langsethiae]GKU21147.1 unnamed protein product [Fusarium langsethiae]
MSQHQQLPDSDGLQVDTHAEQAAKAPEVAAYNQNGHYYVPAGYEAPAPKGQRPPFGLSLWAFAGLVALLTAIIVGAGRYSSDCSADTSGDSESASAPSATAEPTSCPTFDNSTSENDTAPYVPKSPFKVVNLELECPEKMNDETRYKSNKGYEFKWWCGVNAPQGDRAKEGGVVFDYLALLSYSIDDCMEACGNMNQKDDDNNTGVRCRSIVFSKRMSAEMDGQNGNCWLKNASKSEGGNWGFKDPNFAYAELDD